MELDNVDNSKIHRHEKCNIENKIIFMEDHIPIRPVRSLLSGRQTFQVGPEVVQGGPDLVQPGI